jgi:hypothetical protein
VLLASFTVAVAVTDDPTDVDVVDNDTDDFDASGTLLNVNDTGDPAISAPDTDTVAEYVPPLAAVYVTLPTPFASVFVVDFTVNPVPDDVTAAPDIGFPYLSNAYTVTSSTPPPGN